MPTGSTRLSAVAQRRLREEKATTRAQAHAKKAQQDEPPKPSEIVESRESEPDLEIITESSANEKTPAENQFSGLVEAGAVKFSASREIEVLNSKSIKIRLSRGQKCVVLGICNLWVKEGSVTVYGAVFHPSTIQVKVFAPSTHALPAIEAVSKSAEFELNSVDDYLCHLPAIDLKHLWKPPNEADIGNLSFFVLGHSFGDDSRFLKHLRELETERWKSVITTISAQAAKADHNPNRLIPRRIIVSSRGSVGSSTFVRCLVNRFLTLGDSSGLRAYPQGVVLLDLDCSQPEFTPPGTISLVHITDAILGPQFTHPIISNAQANKVLRMHFLGDVEMVDIPSWCSARIINLIEHLNSLKASYKNCPVVLNIPNWLGNIGEAIAESIWQKYTPTDFVNLTSHRGSSLTKLWQTVAKQGNCQLYQLHEPSHDRLKSSNEYTLQLQSYFHATASPRGELSWIDTPLLFGGQPEGTLRYMGKGAEILAIMTLGGDVVLEDTLDILEGSIVAITVVSEQSTSSFMSSKSSGQEEVMAAEMSQGIGNQQAVYIGRTDDEGIPRLITTCHNPYPLMASDSNCLGLGYIKSVDIDQGQVNMISPIPTSIIKNEARNGTRIILIVHRATSDERFKGTWIRREAEHATGQAEEH